MKAEDFYMAGHAQQKIDPQLAAANYKWALELDPNMFAANINLGLTPPPAAVTRPGAQRDDLNRHPWAHPFWAHPPSPGGATVMRI